MIKIDERQAKKLAGEYSLFISFPYNPYIIEAIKSIELYSWDKKTCEWEVPVSKLAQLIDLLTFIDDIQLNVLDNDNKEKLTQICEHKLKPYDYQSEGIDWLINRNKGLLEDPPGLGKTLQIIYAAEELKARGLIDHCLIICGVNTLKQNWKKEIKKCSTESVRVIGEKISKTGTISYTSVKDRADELYKPIEEFFVIINIQSFQNELVVDAIKKSKNNFDMIVCDEIHRCTPTSQQGKSFLKLANVGKYRFGLTGTLLTNSPLNAYAPLKFIGVEKACFSAFKQFYCQMSMNFGHYQIDSYKNLDVLKEELKDHSLRRSKDLLNLPPKTVIEEIVELEPAQEKFYKNVQNGILNEVDKVHIKNTSLLGMVVRLRQAVSCPSVLTSEKMTVSKLERAAEIVEDVTSNGDKVVIFSTFKDPLYKLHDALKAYKPLMCTGDQTEEEVSNNIDSFQEKDDNKVLLCTTQKLGVGVTLTAASYVIFIDTPWVPAEFEQCCDRCWRIGSTKPVIIYSLIAKGTIDERVQEVLKLKQDIANYVVDDKIDSQRADLIKILGIENSF